MQPALDANNGPSRRGAALSRPRGAVCSSHRESGAISKRVRVTIANSSERHGVDARNVLEASKSPVRPTRRFRSALPVTAVRRTQSKNEWQQRASLGEPRNNEIDRVLRRCNNVNFLKGCAPQHRGGPIIASGFALRSLCRGGQRMFRKCVYQSTATNAETGCSE